MKISPNIGLNLPEGSDVFNYKTFLADNLNKLDEHFMRIPASQEIVATEGQTVFNLASSYTVGANVLSVEVDGVPQELGSGFLESSSTSITLTEGVPAGAVVSVTTFNLPAGVNTQIADIQSSLAEITTLNIENFKRQNGETTDDGRFSRAITALSGKAGKIIMPALNYTISQPIILNNFRLCGDSKQTTLTYTGTDAAIKTLDTGWFRSGEVSNLNIVCNNNTAHAMILKGFHMSRFADINTNSPIYVNGDNGAYYNLFENIYIYALNRDYGLKIDSPTSVNDKMTSTTFINVHVFGYTGGASTLVKGFHINSATGLTFIKCYAEGCTEGFYSNNQYNTFISCSVETSATGFELTNNSGYSSLIGCYAFGATTPLILNATNTTIIGGGLPNYLNLPVSDLMTVSSSIADPFFNMVNGRYKNLQVKNKFDANKTFIVTNTTDAIDMFWCSSAGVLTAQGLTVPTLASLPTASATYRNRIATVLGNGTTTADTLYICLMGATGTYSWKSVIVG